MTDKKKITKATIKLDATAEGHRLEDATPEEKAELAASGKKFVDTVTELHRATLKEILQPIFEMLQNEDFQELLKDAEKRDKILTPFIEQVINDNPERYKGITAAAVLENLDVMGRVVNPEELTAEILKRAQKKKRAADARDIQKGAMVPAVYDSLARVKYNQYDTFIFPKDNFTNSMFSISPDIRMEEGKPTLYAIIRSKDKKSIEVKLKAVFTFDKEYRNTFNITDSSIDPGYDRAVCLVCDNLLNNGNNKVTLAKILKELGIPYSQKEANKLLQTLRKLKSINLIVNNKKVLEAFGMSDKYREIDGAFLPIRIIDEGFLVNGNISELTIIIYDYSPFWLVSNQLDQITEYDKELFTLYKGRRTSKYWRVFLYLLNDIAYLRSGRRDSKFLLSTIYAEVGDTDAHQRASTKKLVYELLEQVFIPRDYICSFEKSDDEQFFIASYNKERHPIKSLEDPKKGKK